MASTDAAAPSDRPTVQDTLALSGGLSKTVKGKPNIAITVWFSAIREHRLGQLVNETFLCIPQWKEFLGDAINPGRDLEGVFLFGPRMADTSKVTIIVQSRMQESKIHEVLTWLIRKNPGSSRWIDAGEGNLAARFHADRADRIAFTHPTDLVIVTPPDGYEQLRALREPLSLPPSRGRAVSLTMVTPWRPATRLGFPLPETLSEMRVDLLAAADGGADLKVEFDDKDPVSAEKDAEVLSHQTAELLNLYGGPFGAMLGGIRFTPHDRRIVGETHLSSFASTVALSALRGQICPLGFADAGLRPR